MMVVFAKSSYSLEVQIEEKYYALVDYISRLDGAVTAFSGGVDSSLVAFLAHRILGERALAVTSAAQSLSRADEELTRTLAERWGMAHRTILTKEMDNPNYRENPTNRCYFCKSTLYADLANVAKAERLGVVLNGTNLDDLKDFRPGLEAAKEFGVRSPLSDCQFTKAEIRELANFLGLDNADKPQAACLSSRVPYGLSLSVPMLYQIEKAEAFLHGLGLSQLRVRHHDQIARIEVPSQDFDQVLAHRVEIEGAFLELGYKYVTLDLKGFRSGSLNEGL